MIDEQMKRDVGREEYWKKISDALEASHCLRSVQCHIHFHGVSWPHELFAVLIGLCTKERLTELTIDAKYGLEGTYVLSL